jgi:formylmethanofuran dehydrogenase subunit C
MRIELTMKPRKKPKIPVEAEEILPRNFLGEKEIHVWEGNRERNLADLFTISVSGSASEVQDVEVVLRGDCTRLKRVGEYLDGGVIRIEGAIGMHCGNFMRGGSIDILGDAGEWLAREMRGGTIICRGNASHYCASGYRGEKSGMRGGSVEVFGDAGDFTAEYLTGGSVTIHGSCGDMPGVEMAGGILVIGKDCTRPCGNMKAGAATVHGVCHGLIPTFRKVKSTSINGVASTVFEGDVANRGKGTLTVREYSYEMNPHDRDFIRT